MQQTFSSANQNMSQFYDFVNGIIEIVCKTNEPVTVTIDGKKVTITPEMTHIGTHKVVQILNQYKNH